MNELKLVLYKKTITKVMLIFGLTKRAFESYFLCLKGRYVVQKSISYILISLDYKSFLHIKSIYQYLNIVFSDSCVKLLTIPPILE